MTLFRSAAFVFLASLLGCEPDKTDTGALDGDSDGYTLDEDCDDGDASVNPAATEVCDGDD